MHALLAVAAAHLDTEETMPIGEHHFSQALQKMGVELQGGITDNNCHALFVAISLLNVYALSQARYQHLLKRIPLRADEHGPLLNKLDTRWTFLTRTSFGILNESWTWVTRGPIAPLLLPYPPTPKTMTPLSQPAEAVFLELFKLCSDVSIPGAADELGDVQNATAYFVAAWNLRKVWGVMEECIDYRARPTGTFPLKKIAAFYSAIFQFVLRVPAKFWDAVDRKKPRALIIYAYLVVCFEGVDYSVQMHERPVNDDFAERDHGTRTWWISGRSERDLHCVEDELRTLGVLELWKDWTTRAWSIWEKLRAGRWLDPDEDPFELAMITPDALALTVPQVSGAVIPSQGEELLHFGPSSSLEDQWILDMFDSTQELVHEHHAGLITAEGFI
ncbi:hypothetical protein CPC08DRAFT_714873 [Agrocybe pediades]|nr:hypothetical protein CPC08DRAFT_714873 [Agrocybe pediades]